MQTIKSLSLRKKMIIVFCLPIILLFMVNIVLYMGTDRMLTSLNKVYASNNSLNGTPACNKRPIDSEI